MLFGVIMVLTFTGSLSVASAGRDDVRTMVVGALGCNLAWGIIDGIFYLMGVLAERGRNLRTLRGIRSTSDAQTARRLVGEALPPVLLSVLEDSELDSFQERLKRLPEPPAIARLTAADCSGALGVLLLVFFPTFPVAVPFFFVHDTARAMRLSNAVAVVLLLVVGVAYARVVGRSPWRFGLGMVVLGGALVALTIALGG